MQCLKVCFIGVGSIAKRHIRNLQTVCKNRGLSLQIDAFRRSNSDQIPGVQNVYCCIDDVPDDYDVVFITNPTELHLMALKEFHSKGKHFFIEKPVVSLSQLDEATHFELDSSKTYYVACPLRYNAVIQYVRNNVQIESVISARSISSSYLPDWRPGQDYRNTYSAHKDLGGGVSIDLIHEWDYLTYLFGQPKRVLSLIGKKSSLEIDSDDFAVYLAETEKTVIELHLDYFGRKTIRELQLITNDDTIIGDIANNRISFLVSGKCIDFNEVRDDFQRRELSHFLDMTMGLAPKEDGFRHGLKVLGIAGGITSL